MEDTIKTAVEATTEATEKISFIAEHKEEIGYFVLGGITFLTVEKVVIPTTKKVFKKIKGKFSKKPVETTAEIVEIEE